MRSDLSLPTRVKVKERLSPVQEGRPLSGRVDGCCRVEIVAVVVVAAVTVVAVVLLNN